MLHFAFGKDSLLQWPEQWRPLRWIQIYTESPVRQFDSKVCLPLDFTGTENTSVCVSSWQVFGLVWFFPWDKWKTQTKELWKDGNLERSKMFQNHFKQCVLHHSRRSAFKDRNKSQIRTHLWLKVNRFQTSAFKFHNCFEFLTVFSLWLSQRTISFHLTDSDKH